MQLIKFDGHRIDVLNANGQQWDGTEEAWFVLNQVAEALGAKNPRDYASKILKRNPDKFNGFEGVAKLSTPSGLQEVRTVNENGLYMFLMASDLPKAIEFQRRVTDMLKNIRQGRLQLHKPVQPDELQLKRQNAEARLRNAKARQGKLLLDIAEKFKDKLSSEALQTLVGNATAIMLDQPLLPPPRVEKTYTAEEIAQEAGVSSNKVGRVANKHNMKCDEYGMSILGRSRYSEKQVTQFVYNEKGREELIRLLKENA